jgi:glutathione S-transferase
MARSAQKRSGQPRILFYDWPYSPFCMKVRALLDYKGLEYETINPLFGRSMRTIRRRGKTGKVPAIEIDGEFITDSTDIAYALDQRFPKPPLLPASKRDAGLCHALEEWADEALYFIGLYYRWYEREGRKPIAAAFGRSLTGRVAYRFYLRRILSQIRGHGTLRKPPESVRRDLDRHLDAVGALVEGQPFLLGKQPYLCDFALAGQLEYLRRTPVGGNAMHHHAALERYMMRMRDLTR